MFENLDIPRAWKDADYRESLTPDQRDRLPENPAGLIELSLPGVANFFLGNNSSQWVSNVPTYSGVSYHELYPGIHLVYNGIERQLKRDFIVEPGVNPDQILLNYSGITGLDIRGDGALILQTALGELIETAPVIYQEIDGNRIAISGGYRLLGDGLVGFEIGDYDPNYTLVIDPVLEYSIAVLNQLWNALTPNPSPKGGEGRRRCHKSFRIAIVISGVVRAIGDLMWR